MCFLAREPWIKLPVYALAQTLGAFLGAGIVFGLYFGECFLPCSSFHEPLPSLEAAGTGPTDVRQLGPALALGL